jgi:nucleoside triphosphate diphosphatase
MRNRKTDDLESWSSADMQNGIKRILEVMAALRTPETGCPWDLKQDFASIAPYTLEEAYEVVDAIQRGDMADLKEELGDLLLQVVFHARMAEEQVLFDFNDVANAIADKMVRRHPHVFADGDADTPEAVKQSWEEIKAAEKAEKGKISDSLMDDIPVTLPGLTRGVKIQNRAAKLQFDWTDVEPVFDKLQEEIAEVREAMASGNQDAMEDEIGDLLFVAANIARHLKVDPEKAVRRTNEKFISRFKHLEAQAQATGKTEFTLEELDRFWDNAKAAERQS